MLADALQTTLEPRELNLTQKQNYGVSFADWPRVGPVDVALIEEGWAQAAFLELKWGQGTLYNCVWDLAKMAATVSGEVCGSAFLIAGAPLEDWAAADGAELFSSGTTRLVDLFERHPTHWRKWCKEVNTHALSATPRRAHRPLRRPNTGLRREVGTALPTCITRGR